MDEIERMLASSREDLDKIVQPDVDLLWSQFEHKHLHRKAGRSYRWLLAACLAVLVGIGGGFAGYYIKQAQPPEELSLLLRYPHLADHYERVISEIREVEMQIDRTAQDKEQYKAIFSELESWQQIHNDFKSDLKSYAQERAALKSLIKQYERKLQILQLILLEMDKERIHEDQHFTTEL